jgi:hypothetical protein
MTNRVPENLTLSEECPSCHRRVFKKGDQNRSKRRYSAPRWFRQMFKMSAGTYPLGVYRIVKCEVCNKKMAIFDNNRGILSNQVVTLFACSLLGIPLEPMKVKLEDSREAHMMSCADLDSCYACPLKKGPEYVYKR